MISLFLLSTFSATGSWIPAFKVRFIYGWGSEIIRNVSSEVDRLNGLEIIAPNDKRLQWLECINGERVKWGAMQSRRQCKIKGLTNELIVLCGTWPLSKRYTLSFTLSSRVTCQEVKTLRSDFIADGYTSIAPRNPKFQLDEWDWISQKIWNWASIEVEEFMSFRDQL